MVKNLKTYSFYNRYLTYPLLCFCQTFALPERAIEKDLKTNCFENYLKENSIIQLNYP